MEIVAFLAGTFAGSLHDPFFDLFAVAMILAGALPVKRLMVVLYVIIGAVAMASLYRHNFAGHLLMCLIFGAVLALFGRLVRVIVRTLRA